MSFFQPNMLTSLNPNFDEREWVQQIRQILDEELEDETKIPVTISSVPKPLMIIDPDSYVPQQIAIGPYHHLRPELYEMVRYKIAAAKRTQKELQNVKIHDIVDHLIKLELMIRASYHRPLRFGCETLAWMMAVDGCFLFEFFQVCGFKKRRVLNKVPSRLANLIDLSGNKTACNAILRDIMMLENQIPLFVIRKLMEFHFSSMDLADETLFDMLIELSRELSPCKMVEGSQKIDMKECAHLLDFLYLVIVPKAQVQSQIIEIPEEEADEGKQGEENENVFLKQSCLRQLLCELWKILVNWIKAFIFCKALKVIAGLPWAILCKIPFIRMIKELIENTCSALRNDKEKKNDEEESSSDRPPLLEEIAIPSVTQLSEIGVKFLPTNEGITSINFDEKTLTFYIPIIKLDVNSEVVIRNLVAYEATSVSGPLILTRYTELMNGIIDTDMDVKFLCQRGIIINHMKSEKEVADLWNGMSKSIRLTKVKSLDKVIADVNKYYDGRWKVKCEKFMKQYVFGPWRILAFLAAVVLLLLVSLQAFCQVYSCSRIFRIKALEPPVNHP